eukprot:2393155-Amphidinium_carterae.1
MLATGGVTAAEQTESCDVAELQMLIAPLLHASGGLTKGNRGKCGLQLFSGRSGYCPRSQGSSMECLKSNLVRGRSDRGFTDL